MQLDVGVLQLVRAERQRVANDLVQVVQDPLLRRLAHERQEVPHDLHRARRFALRVLQVVANGRRLHIA